MNRFVESGDKYFCTLAGMPQLAMVGRVSGDNPGHKVPLVKRNLSADIAIETTSGASPNTAGGGGGGVTVVAAVQV